MLPVDRLNLATKCEICDNFVRVAPLSGIEEWQKLALPIRNCPDCGPVDLQVMQSCRESTIGCARN